MSAKENAAVSQLLELLESRYALRVLWALKDGHPQTFRLLQDSIGSITPNTLNTRIKELMGWEPSTRLRDGLEKTYAWIHEQIVTGARDKSAPALAYA